MNAPSSQGTVLRYFGTRTDDVIFESAAVIIGRSVIIILIMLKRLRQDALSPALEGRIVLRHEVDGDHEGSRSGSKRLAVGVGILIAASTCVVAVDPLPIPHFRRPNAHRDRSGALETGCFSARLGWRGWTSTRCSEPSSHLSPRTRKWLVGVRVLESPQR